jgi:2-octaprenyl-6-methoxyphenol hydroxylase
VQYDAEATQIKPGEPFAQVTFNDTKTLQSALIVVADGGRSLDEIDGIERETKEYGHDALVTKVRAELPHHNIAYERFTPTGPMALLPNGERDFSLVWTGLQANIHALSGLSDIEFLKQLHAAFGDRVGQFLSVEKRMCFPLKLSTLIPATAAHLAVIGNAAQTMHPVAGQGFNVGLRDAKTLADLIINSPAAKLGSAEMLKQYSQQRSRDVKGGVLFTDLLVNTFSNDIIGLRAIRGGGLGVLQLLKPAKSFLVNKMSFGK